MSKSVADSGQRPKHLKRDPRTGIWHYRRVVPPHLREAVGRSDIKRSLGTDSERFGSPEFKRAYAKAKAEVDLQILQAESIQPLTKRDEAGLMRQMLVQYEMLEGSELERQFAQSIASMKQQLAAAALPKDALARALIQANSEIDRDMDQKVLSLVLDQLGLILTPDQTAQFLQSFDALKLPLMEKRQQELRQGNFNSVGGVLEQLPEPPRRSVSWKELKQAWIDRRGGIAAVDGHGLSQESLTRAEAHWREIKAISGAFAPSDVTTEMLRDWLKWQRQLGRVPGTIKSNLAIVKAIWSVGLKEGLLTEDVSVNLSVSAPRVEGYAPFNGDQVRMIFKATEVSELDYVFWLPRLGLYTGSRLEEMAQLTPDDVIKHKGVWVIHLKHDPAGKYPKSLKGKELNERMVPLHPWLLSLGFLEFVQSQSEGYIFKGTGGRKGTIGPAASRWHHKLLKRLGIYERRKYVFHSWRGTCKDLCRSCDIPAEIHHALTGHSTGNVGDTSYGETLRFMPNVVFKHIKKLPEPQDIKL